MTLFPNKVTLRGTGGLELWGDTIEPLTPSSTHFLSDPFPVLSLFCLSDYWPLRSTFSTLPCQTAFWLVSTNGRHWQAPGRWKEGRSQGMSHSLSQSWTVSPLVTTSTAWFRFLPGGFAPAGWPYSGFPTPRKGKPELLNSENLTPHYSSGLNSELLHHPVCSVSSSETFIINSSN